MVFKSEKGITYSVIMYSLMIVLSIDIVFDLNVAAFPVQNAFIKKPVLVLFLLLIGSIFFRTKYVLKPESLRSQATKLKSNTLTLILFEFLLKRSSYS